MWSDWGLDPKSHDAILLIPGGACRDTYLSRKDRQEGMKYFDFVVSEVHDPRVKERMDAKAEGRRVTGSFRVFVPGELILALDGVSVGLCVGGEGYRCGIILDIKEMIQEVIWSKHGWPGRP